MLLNRLTRYGRVGFGLRLCYFYCRACFDNTREVCYNEITSTALARKDSIMQYSPDLIRISTELTVDPQMFSLYLVHGDAFACELSGVRCYLNGYTLLCLNTADTVTVLSGSGDILGFCFRPDFYNIGLSHTVIESDRYPDLRARYSYPDFHLFLTRDDKYCGVLPLTADAYRSLLVHFRATEQFIHAHGTDPMWSCHARSRLISVMCLAESAYQGEEEGDADAVIRYIREHVERPMSVESLCRMFKTNRTTLNKTVKAATGLSPMQFVLEERLNQSRPDLLFTALPIGFIAMKYGFANANYYIRAFKQRFGKSPLQYRNEQIEKWRANKE